MSQNRYTSRRSAGRNVKLRAVTTFLPVELLSNQELAADYSGCTAEKIKAKVGIIERQIAAPVFVVHRSNAMLLEALRMRVRIPLGAVPRLPGWQGKRRVFINTDRVRALDESPVREPAHPSHACGFLEPVTPGPLLPSH